MEKQSYNLPPSSPRTSPFTSQLILISMPSSYFIFQTSMLFILLLWTSSDTFLHFLEKKISPYIITHSHCVCCFKCRRTWTTPLICRSNRYICTMTKASTSRSYTEGAQTHHDWPIFKHNSIIICGSHQKDCKTLVPIQSNKLQLHERRSPWLCVVKTKRRVYWFVFHVDVDLMTVRVVVLGVVCYVFHPFE